MVEEAPAARARGPGKAPKKKHASRARREGPSLSKLIVAAVSQSKERKGMSLAALKKVLSGKGIDVIKANKRINTAVTKLVYGGTLNRTKGTGAAGSFKLAKKDSRSAKRTKKVVKKKKAPAKAKKTTAKKAHKKPAAKRPTKKSPKKAPARKTARKVVKKSPKKRAARRPKAARRPAAKKTAARRHAARRARR